MTRGKVFLAVLLNLFVFPGLGQMFLKRKSRGIVIMIAITALLCAMIFHTSYLVAGLIADLPFTTNPVTLAKDLAGQLLTTHGAILKSYFFATALIYFGAVLDVIRIGFKT